MAKINETLLVKEPAESATLLLPVLPGQVVTIKGSKVRIAPYSYFDAASNFSIRFCCSMM